MGGSRFTKIVGVCYAMKRAEDKFLVRMVGHDAAYMELEIVWVLAVTSRNKIHNIWRVGSRLFTLYDHTTTAMQEL